MWLLLQIVDLKCEIEGLDYPSPATMFCFVVMEVPHSYKTLIKSENIQQRMQKVKNSSSDVGIN